ncbi:MAG: oligoribonuclease [Burkholderiales bacterium]
MTEAATPIPQEKSEKNNDHLVWVDMEMTGLVPETDRILEVAVIVTNSQLEIIAEGPVVVVHQSDATLDKMDAWNKGTHGKSGLIDKVKGSALDEPQAEILLLDFLRQYVGKNKAPMCGNTICQDRRFMARWMPTLEAYFHYRNLDVSSFKEVAKRWKPAVVESFKKQQAHTALADIRESIEELKHYREHFIRL